MGIKVQSVCVVKGEGVLKMICINVSVTGTYFIGIKSAEVFVANSIELTPLNPCGIFIFLGEFQSSPILKTGICLGRN